MIVIISSPLLVYVCLLDCCTDSSVVITKLFQSFSPLTMLLCYFNLSYWLYNNFFIWNTVKPVYKYHLTESKTLIGDDVNSEVKKHTSDTCVRNKLLVFTDHRWSLLTDVLCWNVVYADRCSLLTFCLCWQLISVDSWSLLTGGLRWLVFFR